ncbi:MAG TPA: O-antigen ligase family protein [Tianweitania sediminis]|nr:O-antigen ligase family protein [Tianweitania sediminis]
MPRRRRLLVGAAAAAAVAGMLVAVAGSLTLEMKPSLMSALALLDAVAVDGDFRSVHEAIASGAVPFSFGERLMLWMNALEVVALHPVFGAGIGWEEGWNASRYASSPYKLMHNGYAEILVRYGISGLVFFLVLYGAFALHVVRAARQRLIPAGAAKTWMFTLLFFALTLLTNSNNRLAIGESFILISAGFAFCCFYLQQHARNPQIS